jgi:hypothetical protein
LVKLLNEHQEVGEALSGLPLKEQLETVRRLTKAFRTEGIKPLWGLLRTESAANIVRLSNDSAAFKEMIRRHADSMGAQVAQLLPLPTTVGRVKVEELTSGMQLLIEGGRMSHCVAGYTGALRAERSRILSLTAGDKATECSTVEWNFKQDRELAPEDFGDRRLLYPMQVTLGQNRSFGNTPPLAELVEVEERLRTSVNDWLARNVVEGWRMLRPTALAAIERELAPAHQTA